MPPRGVRRATQVYFAAKTVRKDKEKRTVIKTKIMKVVFVSNYFNHHQKPFCEEMYQKLGSDFAFISTSVMREERKKLGYAQGDSPEYVVLAYEGEAQRSRAISLINEADVVIAGSAPNDFLKERIRAAKLLIRYVERPYKKPATCLKRAYHFLKWRQNDAWKNNIYMLCAGGYTAKDYASVGMYKKRTYKWGYFPAVKEYNIDELLENKKSATLLWCGRFIDWKHPDDAICLARKLKENGYEFRLDMIGTGVMEDELKQLVKQYELEDCVTFLGSMSPEQVRSHMENAGIYLFTSDRREGWGAVLNESMNSGCAVVASHEIGSVPFLMKNGENGIIYESGNVEMLYEKVKYLLDNPEMQRSLGTAAYQTVFTEWNAEIAAERLLILADALLKGEKYPSLYENGLCSKAELVYDNWLKES